MALFRLEDKVHVDGVVIGVAVVRVDHVRAEHLNIVRNEEAVHRHAEGGRHIIGLVRRAAGGNGVLRVEGRDEGEPCGDRALLNWQFPGFVFTARHAENLSGSAEKILVEVAAGNAVVAAFVFLEHIGAEHFELLGRDGAVGGVG